MCDQETKLEAAFMTYCEAHLSFCTTRKKVTDKRHLDSESLPYFSSSLLFSEVLSSFCVLSICTFTYSQSSTALKKKYLPVRKTVIHVSLLQLAGYLWMTKLLEVCLPKGELFSRSIWAPTTHLYLSLSPFHLIPSSHPFGLSRSFLKLQSQKGRERESQATGFLHNNIHMGDLNKPQNNNLSHSLKSMILRTTRFIYQFSVLLLFLSRKICQSFMLFS